jgi:hypothetical protein
VVQGLGWTKYDELAVQGLGWTGYDERVRQGLRNVDQSSCWSQYDKPGERCSHKILTKARVG